MNSVQSIRDRLYPNPTVSDILQPASDASFSLLDNRPVLFSESAQKIYELNPVGAYIWCSLLDHKATDRICEDLTKFGLDLVAARQFVQQALRNWFKLGLLRANWDLSEQQALTGRIGRLTVSIQSSSERLAEILIPLFNEVSRGKPSVDDKFEILEIDGQVHVLHNKVGILWCAVEELVPAVKAYLTEQILERSSPDVALHAACLVAGGKGLLISGRPGAGKTTLALHLMNLGLEYCGDDIALIAPDGRAEGVPFPPTIKSGAWGMISKLRGNLTGSIVHKRQDGKRVRYLKVSPRADIGGFPVGWIVFLNRVPDAPATLAPLGQLETLSRVMNGSYAAGGKLTQKAFAAIKRTATEARSFELTYSSAVEAGAALVDVCNGKP
jgi:hypothetical protein